MLGRLLADGLCPRSESRDQLHFDLLASTKLLTALTTADALLTTVAIWLAEGFARSTLTALVSASTEDLIALVWLGKSPFAWVTTAWASVWTFFNAASRSLTLLLGLKLVAALTEFSRLVRAEQYAGLLPPQAASATSPTMAILTIHAFHLAAP